MTRFERYPFGSRLTLVPYESGQKSTDFTNVSLVYSVYFNIVSGEREHRLVSPLTAVCVVRENQPRWKSPCSRKRSETVSLRTRDA